MKNLVIVSAALMGVLAGVAGQRWASAHARAPSVAAPDHASGSSGQSDHPAGGLSEPARTGTAIAYYTCSMHPSVRATAPGHCPICGMDLTPVLAQDLDSGVISVDSERRQRIGVTTGVVRRVQTARELWVPAILAADEARERVITLALPGTVTDLGAATVGMAVAAGTPLFTLSSPELVAAENDYLLSLTARPAVPTAIFTAHERLRLAGMSAGQIDDLRQRGHALAQEPILAPSAGVILSRELVPGARLDAGAVAVRLADFSSLWAELALSDDDAALVAAGMPATITVPSLPGATWSAPITAIDAMVDAQTHTTRARVRLSNAAGQLRPGLFARAQLHVPLGERLVVPEDAVIRAGATSLVFIDLGAGRLTPQLVSPGLETADGLEILSGLQPGMTVVTHATFLLAAESRLTSGAASW